MPVMIKKMEKVKKFAKKVKVLGGRRRQSQVHESLMRYHDDQGTASPSSATTAPVGFFAVYVGEDRQRFIVPTGFLSHPLFKMLLEKAYEEYGFEQRHGLVVPCSVSLFQEVVSAVECTHGQFDIEKMVDEFI